jgi:hypothetical protein
MKKGGTMKKMQNGGPNNIEKKIGRLENKKERLANKSSRASSISRNFQGDPDTLSKVVDNALQKRAMNVMEKVSNKREMINKKIEKLKSSNASSSMKKMAKGGVQKIVGMPGYNATTRPITMKKGGAKKTLIKAQAGRSIVNPKELSDKIKRGPGIPPPTPYGKVDSGPMVNTRVDSGPTMNPDSSTKEAKLPTKKEVREDRQYDRKNARRVKKGFRPLSGPSFKKGGSTSFGMLSVKAGVDKNPKATAADRIAGAKMSKKQMGGMTKSKKK